MIHYRRPLEVEAGHGGDPGRGKGLVAGLDFRDDEVRLLSLGDGREESGTLSRPDGRCSSEVVVPDPDGPVSTFREDLSDGLLGPLRADGDRDDLDVFLRVLRELDCCLEGVPVPLVEVVRDESIRSIVR